MKKPGSKTSPHSTLNYMKSTASADARREQSKVSRQSPQTSLNKSSLHTKSSTNSPIIYPNSRKDATERLARTNSLKMRSTSKKINHSFNKKGSPETLKVEGETCSSGVKVCSYRCCSLNGHQLSHSPPIKSFVSARRRTLKTDRSLKVRSEVRPTLSSPNCDELIGRDARAIPDVHEDFMIKSDDVNGKIFDEISVDDVPQETFDEESLSGLLFEGTETPRIDLQISNTNTTTRCNASDEVEHNLKEESLPNEEATTKMENQAPYLYKDCVEVVDNDQDHVEKECNHRKIPETEEKRSRRAAVECKKSNQECDEPRLINPQALHFLPLEPDPEAERFRLRRQQLDARKNAEEWMVDYALREAVSRISPARQREVALLVEAFERVLPISKS